MITVSAPANLALIKYMGKSSHSGNRASNVSLSWTLKYLRSFVEMEQAPDHRHLWQPSSKYPTLLSPEAQTRVFGFLDQLNCHFGLTHHYKVISGNNFPADCGLASSSSAFAALTLAFLKFNQIEASKNEMAQLARLGSGSACRSFADSWALWSDREVSEPAGLPTHLAHAVFISDSHSKAVSSRSAHKQIETSLLAEGRALRANSRLEALLPALKSQAWYQVHSICWSEFWDMHALFLTSAPSFNYINPTSYKLLFQLKPLIDRDQLPLIVTLDAGPNIHFLWPSDWDFTAFWSQFLADWPAPKNFNSL